MRRRRGEACLSDWVLDRWLAGELTLSEQRLAEVHVSGCDGCRSRRAELLEARQDFLRDAPFEALVGGPSLAAPPPERAASMSRRMPLGGRWLAGVAAVAAAAGIALAVGQPWRSSSEAFSGATRAKGGIASLSWVVRRGERVFSAHPRERLRAGDAVRFSVSTREGVYVAIVGFDADAQPRVFFPDGERLARVEAGRDRVLAMAIELDASPHDEQGWAVYCRSAELVASVREAIARSADAPRLPELCSAERWTLPKERP